MKECVSITGCHSMLYENSALGWTRHILLYLENISMIKWETTMDHLLRLSLTRRTSVILAIGLGCVALILLPSHALALDSTLSSAGDTESRPLWDSDWAYTLSIQPAWFDYQEDSNAILSDWDAYGIKLNMALESYDQRALEGGVELGFSVTQDDSESWRQSTVLRQTNDMNLWSIDFVGEVGWALRIRDKLTLTPIAAYGFRHIEFRRTRFNITTAITTRDIVDEEHDIHYIDVGSRIHYELTERLSLDGRFSYGFVVKNDLSNSVTDEVEGDNGSLVKAELSVGYTLSKDYAVALGGFLDLQKLDEKTTGGNTWPENELKIFGITAEVSYLF